MLSWLIRRRDVLSRAAAVGLFGGLTPRRASAQSAAPSPAPAITRQGLECIILGTKGGLRVTPGRSNPGYVFLVDGDP